MKKCFLLIFSLACVLFSCSPDPVVPTVITSTIVEITENSAKSGGNVSADGGAEVTSRGVCWSKNQGPTINDNRTDDGTGVGSFISNIANLEDSTKYYVRAYAINEAGVAYGEELSFMTSAIDDDSDDDSDDDNDDNEETEIYVPTVSTLSIDSITYNSAVTGGNVTDDGGAEVIARGVCWGTEQNPTIADNHTSDGKGDGEFSSILTELDSNTQYYVRAYATNEKGTAYGDEVSFTTLEEDEEDETTIPTVTTTSITNITETSAEAGGDVISDGGETVTSRGICLSKEPNPTIDDSFISNGDGTGEFIIEITGLEPGTTYYVRAFATNSKGTAYGDEVSFTTIVPDDGTINGYEYIDLGLPSGVKWATHNVGASSPSEAGNYYAWGEIVTKSEYTEANCTTYQLNMENISGNPQYDVAAAEWGASWRIPTKEEFEELLNNCTWQWEVVNGVGCKKITGPNGNYIHLPISGYKYGSAAYMQDFGYYWTSTPIEMYENFSYDFLFDMEYNLTMGFDDRCYGQTIRPVSD